LAASAADASPPAPSWTKSSGLEPLRRHVFVRLEKDAWERTSAAGSDPATLRDWLAHDRPLIVRRPCLSDDGRGVFLGLALPGKRRLAYQVPVDAISSVEPPPLWRGEFPAPFAPRLFGSHAWQELTGLAYVTKTSDVDLLVDISSLPEWETFLKLVGTDGPSVPNLGRLDLEIIFRGDASFSWREYLGPTADLLLKSNRHVWLERKDRLATLLA
jgi:phosphoribosyl-dephospho-CoA transferase